MESANCAGAEAFPGIVPKAWPEVVSTFVQALLFAPPFNHAPFCEIGLSAAGNCVEKLPLDGGGFDGGEEGGCADPVVLEPPPQDTQISKLRKQESQISWGEGLEKFFISYIPFQPHNARLYMMYFLVIK